MNDVAPFRANIRLGWTALAVFAALGLGLEALHLIKAPDYLEVRLRRELWVLAHAHGVLLALINIVFGLYAKQRSPVAGTLVRPGQALRFAAVAMPAGFLLGGIGNTESDPSLAIVLVPLGAVAVIYALYRAARSSFIDD